jgi:hypothetical protein
LASLFRGRFKNFGSGLHGHRYLSGDDKSYVVNLSHR